MKKLRLGLVMLMLSIVLVLPAFAAPTWDKDPKAFVHGIKVWIDGQDYYFKGPAVPDTDPLRTDVPGHTWVQTGPYQFEGRHYNIGPIEMPPMPFWATGEEVGVLLFKVHGIAAPTELDPKMELKLRKQGYVHRHELIYASDPDGVGPLEPGDENEDIRVYLKHIAVREFYFDGGPPVPVNVPHQVHPGIDREFMPNW